MQHRSCFPFAPTLAACIQLFYALIAAAQWRHTGVSYRMLMFSCVCSGPMGRLQQNTLLYPITAMCNVFIFRCCQNTWPCGGSGQRKIRLFAFGNSSSLSSEELDGTSSCSTVSSSLGSVRSTTVSTSTTSASGASETNLPLLVESGTNFPGVLQTKPSQVRSKVGHVHLDYKCATS